MQYLTFALMALSTLVAAAPRQTHNDCEYSGVAGGAFAQGTCQTGGKYGQGVCKINGYGDADCDYPYRNSDQSPCGNARDSQYACKSNGQPCWAFKFAENQALSVIHCGVQ